MGISTPSAERELANGSKVVPNQGDQNFTMDIWKPGEASRTIVPKVNVVETESFPYLDMKMEFDENPNLCFGVYTKYLNVATQLLAREQ